VVSVVPGLGGVAQGVHLQDMVTPVSSVGDGKKEI